LVCVCLSVSSKPEAAEPMPIVAAEILDRIIDALTSPQAVGSTLVKKGAGWALLSYPCPDQDALFTVKLVIPRGEDPARVGIVEPAVQAEVCFQAWGRCPDVPQILSRAIQELWDRGLGVSISGPCRA